MVKIYFDLFNSGEVLYKSKSKGFLAFSVPTYDFSTLYTILPHNLIKEKLTELIEHFLIERALFIWLVTRKTPFSLLNNLSDISYGHVREIVTLFIFFSII